MKEKVPTWAWVLIVIGIVIVFISIRGFFSSNTNEDEEKYVYDWEKERIKFLEEDYGFEVMSLSYGSINTDMAIQRGFTKDTSCYDYIGSYNFSDIVKDICWSKYVQADINMKSLGNRNEQIYNGLVIFAGIKGISLYVVTILEPTQTCKYTITGKSYNAMNDVDLINNYSEENLALARQLRSLVDIEIEKYKVCS